MEIETIVLDMNGTIATDGKITAEIKAKINSLAQKVKIYVLTADTQGTASEEVKGLTVELVKIEEEGSVNGKFEFLKTINPEKTVVIGNGNNDQLILKETCLGIGVLGEEGMAVSAMKHADLVVKSIADALDLFMKPKRLMATLRE
jgi:soluble P-type ATPase